MNSVLRERFQHVIFKVIIRYKVNKINSSNTERKKRSNKLPIIPEIGNIQVNTIPESCVLCVCVCIYYFYFFINLFLNKV